MADCKVGTVDGQIPPGLQFTGFWARTNVSMQGRLIMRNEKSRLVYVATALLLAGMACGLVEGTAEPPTEAPPQTEEVSDGGASPDSLDSVREATVQIEAQGTFVDPEFGLMVNTAGRGSGFIIDPSGLAVTNNHVVTGAGLLRVWVGGESEPRNARILGVSECSDLAVIEIDGNGYPYVEWHESPADVGLEVYAAGFPLGDPEYTLTKGIVSKANADGESSWASVDGVLEHDARINPGNSGGPLVDAQGRVVGVNYAGASSVDQYFAIKSREALSVIDVLRQGSDQDSLGVNGMAVVSEDGSLSGIWVSSVASGSPADEAGVQAGDVMTSLEGIVLATDGTMADYCDVLRTHGADATLAVEVVRYSTGEYLAGQINGRPLETSFSFGNQLEDDVPGNGAQAESYSGYMTVTDEYGAIEVEVPDTWTDVDGRPWVDGGEVIGASLYAANDLDAFLTTWSEPGVIFNVSDDLARLGGYVQLLDILSADFRDQCELDGRYDYEDPLYRGKYDFFVNCGGPGGAWYLLLSTVPIDSPQDYLLLVEVQIISDADVDALDRILNTFQVVGTLP